MWADLKLSEQLLTRLHNNAGQSAHGGRLYHAPMTCWINQLKPIVSSLK